MFALAFISTTVVAAESTWVDLTHPLSSESVFWPTARPFELTTDAEGRTEAGYYYSAYSFSAAEHGGTHIDAPVHFAEGRRSVDEIPLSQLMGPAVVIDVSHAADQDRDHRISVSEITDWESIHGPIPHDAIVLFRTGFSRYWPNAEAYLGTALTGEAGVAALHFPGLHPDAAAWLVSERDVKAVGIDTASIDYGQSKAYASHVALMTANVPAFENVASLDRVPATGAWVMALPMKIEGGSGGPLRIVARLPEEGAESD
jgi:kynurenine formamidase